MKSKMDNMANKEKLKKLNHEWKHLWINIKAYKAEIDDLVFNGSTNSRKLLKAGKILEKINRSKERCSQIMKEVRELC